MKELIIRKGAELNLNAQDASPHQFARKVRHGGSDFLGAPDANVDLSRATRRQIMQALRKSCETLGVGQKSRIGRLGGGVAVSAIVLGITGPATAQYAAGGGVGIVVPGTVSSLTITNGGTTYDKAMEMIIAEETKTDNGVYGLADAMCGGSAFEPVTGVITPPVNHGRHRNLHQRY